MEGGLRPCVLSPKHRTSEKALLTIFRALGSKAQQGKEMPQASKAVARRTQRTRYEVCAWLWLITIKG